MLESERFLQRTSWVFIIALLLFSFFVHFYIQELNSKQLVSYSCYLILSSLVFVVVKLMDDVTIVNRAPLCFYAVLLLLVLVLFLPATKGVNRWIDLRYFSIQPSELMKFSLPLYLTYLNKNHAVKTSFWRCMLCILIILIAFSLIIIQPDLGTAVFILFEGLFFLLVARANKRVLIIFFSILLCCVPFVYYGLKPYQMLRIIIFLNHESQAFGHGFQIMQSLSTISSGGVWGIGDVNNSLGNSDFLVHANTDFIFSRLCQFFGFAGIVLFFICILGGLWRLDRLVSIKRNHKLYALKKTYIFSIVLAILINSGMNAGLLPVVGLPFPLLSYGGSNFIVICMMLAIVVRWENRSDKCN